MDKKIIVFEYQDGWGEHNKETEEVEFDIDDSEELIQQCYEDWVWDKIGDKFNWHEKE